MNRIKLLLSLFLGIIAISMPFGDLSAQQLWKTCWSPDGESIAFGDGPDIWMIDSEGGGPVNLTLDVGEECSCPVFSRDGFEIIYSTLQTPKDIHFSERKSNVCAMNLVSGETRTVLENAYAATFSSDGRFATYIKDWVYNAVYDFQSETERVYDFFNSGPPYFSGGHTFLSPDNNYFITRFEYGTNTPLWSKYKLYRVAIETGEAEIIDIDNKNYVYPKYSPDGSRLLFSQSGVDELYHLVMYDLASGKMTSVEYTETLETKCGSWSPDGSKVCYILNDGDISALYVYDIGLGDSMFLYSKSVSGATFVENTAPLNFDLHDNYPNPFNNSTTIEFSLHSAGDVHLNILNIMGQKVRELPAQNMNPGVHSVVWNGRDENGNTVSSGTYFCRLMMGEQVATRQMMLAK